MAQATLLEEAGLSRPDAHALINRPAVGRNRQQAQQAGPVAVASSR